MAMTRRASLPTPRIGEALKRAHQGEFKVDYSSDEYGIRAHRHR